MINPEEVRDSPELGMEGGNTLVWGPDAPRWSRREGIFPDF